MNKFFSRKRVIAILAVVFLFIIISSLPPLTPPAKPESWLRLPTADEVIAAKSFISNAIPLLMLIAFLGFIPGWLILDIIRESSRKNAWKRTNLQTPISFWRIADDAGSKELLIETTLGTLLAAQPDGFTAKLPAKIGPENGIAIIAPTRQVVAQIHARSDFDKAFPMRQMTSGAAAHYTLKDIRNAISREGSNDYS